MTDRETLHPDELALLRAVYAEPDDDTPRLVLADWYQEAGQDERAKFIRVQIELSRMPTCDAKGNIVCDKCQLPTSRYRYTKRCSGRVCRLRMKEYYSSRRYITWDWTKGIPPGTFEDWSRGFVSRVEISCAEFIEHAEAIFRAHPVTAVRLKDVKPDNVAGEWWWYAVDTEGSEADVGEEFDPSFPANLPDELFFAMPGTDRKMGENFDTQLEAVDWLSRRAVAHGRTLAVLPPLPFTPESHSPEPAVKQP